MSSQMKYVAVLKRKDNPNIAIEIYIRYSLGGYSYSSSNSRRGYSVHIQPVEYHDNSTQYNPREGMRMFILPATKFSQKTLDAAVRQMTIDKSYKPVLDAVCSSNDLNLEDYDLTIIYPVMGV